MKQVKYWGITVDGITYPQRNAATPSTSIVTHDGVFHLRYTDETNSLQTKCRRHNHNLAQRTLYIVRSSSLVIDEDAKRYCQVHLPLRYKLTLHESEEEIITEGLVKAGD